MPENCTLALKSRQRRRLRTNTAGYINKRIISLARQTQVRFYRLQPPCSSFRVLLIQGRIYVYIREKNKDVFRLKCLYDYQSLIKKKISIYVYIQINNKKKERFNKLYYLQSRCCWLDRIWIHICDFFWKMIHNNKFLFARLIQSI